MASQCQGRVPKNVKAFLDNIRKIANELNSWTKEAESKFCSGIFGPDETNDGDKLVPCTTLYLVKDLAESTLKHVDAQIVKVEDRFDKKPLSRVMNQTLKSYCQLVKRLGDEVQFEPNDPILLSSTFTESDVVLEIWTGPMHLQKEDLPTKLTVALLMNNQPFMGPFNLTTLNSIVSNESIMASYPLNVSVFPKSLVITAQVMFDGTHIEGSPSEILPKMEIQQQPLPIWSNVGDSTPPKSRSNDTNLDESDLRCMTLNATNRKFPITVPRESSAFESNATDSDGKNDSMTNPRNVQGFQLTLTTVPESSKDGSDSNSMNKSERELSSGTSTNPPQLPKTPTSGKLTIERKDQEKYPQELDTSRNEMAFQDRTLPKMSKTWLPADQTIADQTIAEQVPNDQQVQLPADKINIPLNSLGILGTPKAVKDLRPNVLVFEAIPLDQPSPLSSRVAQAPRRELEEIDEQAVIFKPSVSSTSSNLSAALSQLPPFCLGNQANDNASVVTQAPQLFPEPVSAHSYKNYHHLKTVHFREFLKQEEVSRSAPQDLAVDLALNRLYVTDIGHNKVYLFEDHEYKGDWFKGTTFLSPGNILVLSHTQNPHDVLVLDKSSLRQFDKDGVVKKTFFKGSGGSYRTLAFHQDSGHIVTLESSPNELKIVFFDLSKEDIARKVPVQLQDTSKQKNQLCRFLDCSKDKVFVSDIGNGAFYVTDLPSQTTRTIDIKTNGFGLPSGLAIVQTDNLFIGVRGKVLCYSSSDGSFVGSLDVPCASDKIGSLRFFGGKIYFTDYEKHAVHILAEKK